MALEHQEGDVEVVFVGKLFGNTVATLHRLREGGRLRDYVAIHGHLDGAATGLKAGAVVREGDLLGYVGDSGSEGIVHLHYEIRQVRDSVDPSVVRSKSLALPNVSIVCDPRNVLPLQAQAGAAPSRP
jgi:murein DD-endopeptidase MepM/ murein hydrolase activator NlpD